MRHLACTGKANFNHFKSSLRMPVEQCFGRNYGLWGAASKAASPLRDPPLCNHDPPSVAAVAGVFWRPSRMGVDCFPHLISACFKLSNFMLRYRNAEREEDRCDEQLFRSTAAEEGGERSIDDVREMLTRNFAPMKNAPGLPNAAPSCRKGRWALPSGQPRWMRSAMMDKSALRDSLADNVMLFDAVRPGGKHATRTQGAPQS